MARRFQLLGSARGVEVVDDFGHNPAKVAASIRTAHLRAGRVLAVFQPHGYGPMRFLRADFVEAFAAELHPEDRALDAGDLLRRGHRRPATCPRPTWWRTWRGAASGPGSRRTGRGWRRNWRPRPGPGDLILVMGARDPSLTVLARDILAGLR